MSKSSDVPPVASGTCRGTLGELWQGPVEFEGRDRLAIISLPVALYSRASYVVGDGDGAELRRFGCKRAAAHDRFVAHYGVTCPAGRWQFDSGLPVGHGMASSTADIVALLRCLYELTSIRYEESDLRTFLRGIERSDPVFLDSLALYLSGAQRVVEEFAAPVRFHACYVLGSTKVTTSAIGESRLLKTYGRNRDEYADSLDTMRGALAVGDRGAIAGEATRSALLAQEYLKNPLLDSLVADLPYLGAQGVARAHTGSLLALLYDEPISPQLRDTLRAYFRSLGRDCHFAEAGVPESLSGGGERQPALMSPELRPVRHPCP